MKRICAFGIIFICLINHMTPASDPRGLLMVEEKEKQTGIDTSSVPINSMEAYDSIVPQDTYVFLVGNNAYEAGSGYPELKQCLNDVTLLKHIFIQCCKVQEHHIFSVTNASYSHFARQFTAFIQGVPGDSLVIFFFSGHGNQDGSLVFVDGEAMPPVQLKELINSFSQDTVLILDACYSGNNDGILERYTGTQQFKNNCIRIYSALAHSTAKEISYDNEFFRQALPFYHDVLGLELIEGNGYFTALIGLFFSYYKIGKKENISYADLVYYITNTGKIYTETLAAVKGEEQRSAWDEVVYRLNQYPKIHPADESASLRDPNHGYLILRKKYIDYRPAGNHVSLISRTTLPIVLGAYRESLTIGAMQTLSFMYNMKMDWGIAGFGLLSGTQWLPTDRDVQSPYHYFLYPVGIKGRYHTDFSGPLYLSLDLFCGAGFNQLVFTGAPRPSVFDGKFIGGATFSAGFNPIQSLGMALSLEYIVILPYEELFQMICPGIDFIFVF